MNPQYIQQQHPVYGPPQPNASYNELNANHPPKGLPDSHSFPIQKLPVAPPPANNALPPRPPYYINDIQGQTSESQQRLPVSQPNQNNLVDQMSNMALSGPQRPSSSQGFPLQSEKNVPTIPVIGAVNGINNQNHAVQDKYGANNLPVENSGYLPQKPLQHQQGPPTSSSLPPSYAPPTTISQFVSQQQYSGQTSLVTSQQGPNIPRSIAQPTPPISTDHQSQMPSQNQYGPPLNYQSQADLAGPPLPGRQPTVPMNNQQSFKGSPVPGQPQVAPLTQPPLGPPRNQQSMPPSSALYNSNPATANRQSLSGPPMSVPNLQSSSGINQQNVSKPYGVGQVSGISGPPMSVPNLQGSSGINQQNVSKPYGVGQVSGPPLPGQANLSGSYGQASATGPPPLPGQQNLHSQYSYGNQIPEQRRFSSSPAMSAQPNSAYSHMNHQHSDIGYQQQGYQQQSYNQTGQSNTYSNQTSSYQSGMTSPTSGYQSNTQPQQARRLDPDQMPSPIQVILDDQRTKGGVFATNEKGLVPPLVTTKFTVDDGGNASPRFIRSSMYTVPTTADIIKQTQIPFSLILNPMAQVEEGEYEPVIVDMGEVGPVRCNRCKAYMSPFMQFVDAGRRFQCTFCKATTEVPSEYFQHLDHTGQRMDRFERPELSLGTYEFIATKDYCRNNTFPKPPAIIFVIDVSYNNIKSGLVHLLCSQMKKIIRNLPVDVGHTKSNMRVGFITYNNTVQFYNLKASLAQPQMMVVGDVQDVFMPLLDGFLCDPEESEALIDSLMFQIPAMFGDTKETETILAPAIQAGLEALKASDCTGKLMVFHSSLPIAEAPGKLKNRDDRKLLGTEKEKTVLAPQTNFYNNLGQDCVGSGCSVDLFIFNNSYVDIATIGQVARLTGGEVYKYTYFQADVDGERLIADLINNINRPVAFDAVMRVRTSTGVRPTDFYGHFFMSNTTDIELASIDCDKALAIEIKHDDKLSEDEGVYIQAALLYTSCSGVRRLRIINLSLKTSSQMAELYRACDLDAIVNYLSKKCVFQLVDSTPKAVKDSLNSRCAAILASYRKHCASPSSAGQLILPECMKLLPLYTNGLLKSDAITGGNGITLDQKSYVMMATATMPISESLVHVYPRLLPLHDVDPKDNDLPPMLRCSIDKFLDDGAYLLENGIHMFIWLGSNLDSQWVQSVFGVANVTQVDTARTAIPPLDNPLNSRIRDIISYVQSERRYCMQLTLTKQRDKMEMVMRQFLVEDRGADGSPGYVDFLCHMHREIRTLLS